MVAATHATAVAWEARMNSAQEHGTQGAKRVFDQQLSNCSAEESWLLSWSDTTIPRRRLHRARIVLAELVLSLADLKGNYACQRSPPEGAGSTHRLGRNSDKCCTPQSKRQFRARHLRHGVRASIRNRRAPSSSRLIRSIRRNASRAGEHVHHTCGTVFGRTNKTSSGEAAQGTLCAPSSRSSSDT